MVSVSFINFLNGVFVLKKNILKKMQFMVVIIFLLFLSFFPGVFLGKFLKSKIVSNSIRFPLVLFSPNIEFIKLYSLIYSRNDLKRISGYYGLASLNVSSLDFYKEKLKFENSIVAKRILLRTIIQKFNYKDVCIFIEEYYKTASESEKKVIWDILKINNNKKFMKLIERMK